jgi:hypothetical protein
MMVTSESKGGSGLDGKFKEVFWDRLLVKKKLVHSICSAAR